jgi:hypothetical protein
MSCLQILTCGYLAGEQLFLYHQLPRAGAWLHTGASADAPDASFGMNRYASSG